LRRYEEFERVFVDTEKLSAKLRAGLEHLAVHGCGLGEVPVLGTPPGEGAAMFHSVMDSLPPVDDKTG